jgi:UDP-N-acetyl-D-mannosaminuronic acid dehydrogenase
MTSAVESRRLYGSDADVDEIGDRFANGEFPVAVYGLGKMGLPIASVFADVSGNVVGADIDPEVVEAVNAGDCHVQGEPGLPELVSETVADGALRAVDDPAAAAREATLHVVIVPTLLTDDNEPDLSGVRAVVDDVAAGLESGDLVAVESTVPPRTCRDVVEPRLAEASGLDTDEFGVAFCPERTSSGRALVDIRKSYPKVVGGVDDESTRVVAAVYDEVTNNDVVTVSDATTAEAVKVFYGVYRDVNIALANEFATYADALRIDVREAIEAANTIPQSHILDPGPGVGGHCIPVYPYFLFNEFDVYSPVIRMARAVNDGMPSHVVKRLRRGLEEAGTDVHEATVLVLGVTYRAGVEETRNSPALDVLELLSDLGAETVAVDPLIDDVGDVAELVSRDAAAARDLDAVVLATPHEEFERFRWDAHEDLVVVDTRDVLDLSGTDHSRYVVGKADDA